MATVFFRSVPTQTYEDLLHLDRDARDLYLWMSIGPFSGRNGLVTFHRREPEGRVVGRDGVDAALGVLADEDLIDWCGVGSRRVVSLLPQIHHLPPRGPNELRGWLNDAESDPDCDVKARWVIAVNRKYAESQRAKGQGVSDGSRTGLGHVPDGSETKKQKQKQKQNQNQEPPTEVEGFALAPQVPPDTATKEPDMTATKLKERKFLTEKTKAVELLNLYREICVSAGMTDMRGGGAGNYSQAMINAARIAMVRNGTDFNWRTYLTYCVGSGFLCGRSQPTDGRRRFRADFSFITGSQNQAKIESGKFHGDQTHGTNSTAARANPADVNTLEDGWK